MSSAHDSVGVRLTEEQRAAWLRLSRSENVGPATFRTLINSFGSAQAAIDALPTLARRGGGRAIRIADPAEVAREIEAAARIGARFIAMGEPDYPPWLRHADAPPPLICARGGAECLVTPGVAIVGARNASVAGRKMAALLARDLGGAGLTIVSGLARGIDAAAHEAALHTGTLAVMAGGIDIVYPPENEALFAAILDHGGAAISEMPVGWSPRGKDFPRRNRIIAGMTLATIVVEAAERSGSLITARLALEQNRDVMAVPGSPVDPRAAGANRLIKQGARLVTEAADVLDAIAPLLEREPPPRRAEEPEMVEPVPEPAADDRSRVQEALGPTPVEIDEIVRFTGIPARTVQVILLELDLAGRLERHAGNRVSLKD
jgi:DNA processing protein